MPSGKGRVRYSGDYYGAFKLGRLQVVGRFAVQAGETIDASVRLNVGFHPHRRPGARLVSEMWGFYAPYRWSYPKLVTALTEGYDGTTSWAKFMTIPGATNGAMALMTHRNSVPLHYMEDYAAIVEHHFREPHLSAEVTKDNVLSATVQDDRDYGYRLWQIKRTPQTRINWSDAHDEVSMDAGTDINALDLAKYVAMGRDEQVREWESIRTEDIYARTYGGKLNREVLKVPMILGHEAKMTRMSSQEVDPQQDISMGRSMQSIKMRIPRWRALEHGTIYILHATRVIPTYLYGENYLENPARFAETYKMSGHPVSHTEKPVEMPLGDMFVDTESSTSAGFKPFGQWHEEGVSFVNRLYTEVDEGWHFLKTPSTKEGLHRHPDYDGIFTTVQFGHGQLIGSYSVSATRSKTIASVKSPAVGGPQGAY